ncbi:MAG: MFS transporter [Melioribacteraceae bacterium]|nr:MFS transporter [Melioribacteraceae bacterium]MCF8265136.1 MFS transporter [Melioribacteraceae bacterium]
MKKIKGLRWWIITLVAIATVINYIDRGALSIMWPEISKDLGMTKEDYSTIAITFTIAYALSQTLSGRLYDWIGTRMGFVFSIVLWSVSVAFHGLARGMASFSIFRFFLGLGEAGNWPGATKSNAEWFPIKERALAQGIFNSGASIGSIISPPFIAFLYLWIGWELTFVLLGFLGILWIVPWLFINKALPKDHPWVTDSEKEYILSDQKDEKSDEKPPSWGKVLKQKKSWAVLASRFFLDPIWWLFVFWLPIYLADTFDFDIKQIGLFAWMPYVGAATGAIFGGWIAGKWMNSGWSLNKARKGAIVLGAAIMLPALIFTSVASTPLVAVILIALILFGFQTSISNIQTLPSDFFSGKSVGSLAGLGGTTAAIGVVLTTYIVPALTVDTYAPFFILGAILVPLGVASVYIFGGQIEKTEMK